MKLYDACFKRKSARKISTKKVKNNILATIDRACRRASEINKSGMRIELIEQGYLVNLMSGEEVNIKAPHYIAVYREDRPLNYIDVGRILEHFALQLTSLGLATNFSNALIYSNYLKDTLNIKSREFINVKNEDDDIEDEEEDNLEEITFRSFSKGDREEVPLTEVPLAVFLAFGYPEKNEHLFRDENEKMDRFEIDSITKFVNDVQWGKILEAAVFAPSYRNLQPWRFSNSAIIDVPEFPIDNKIFKIIKRKKRNKNIGAHSLDVYFDTSGCEDNFDLIMLELSMGACIKNIEIAAKHFGCGLYITDEVKNDGENLIYLITLNMKNYK